MYCQRKGWRLDSISAKYEHNKVHADDCDDCDDADKGYIDRVTSEIFIEGDFDDEQRRQFVLLLVLTPTVAFFAGILVWLFRKD